MEQFLGSSSNDLLPAPVEGGRSLTKQERNDVDLSPTISGWGSDLDRAIRPGVPRDKAPEIGVESLYPPLTQQAPTVRIHKSTEHARLTPVFGTGCPPTGLSGRMRDAAYKYSEGRLERWLTLLAADRVNVFEDIVADLARLRVPNVIDEMGLRSEWRYSRNRVVSTAAIAIMGIAALSIVRRSRRRRR